MGDAGAGRLDQQDRLLAVTTIGFDIAALELFLPLVNGASLAIAPQEIVRDPLALGRLIEQTAPTIVQGTPTLWQSLVTTSPAGLGNAGDAGGRGASWRARWRWRCGRLAAG